MAGEAAAAEGLGGSLLGTAAGWGGKALSGGMWAMQAYWLLSTLLGAVKNPKPGTPRLQEAEDARALATLSDYSGLAKVRAQPKLNQSGMMALQMLQQHLSPGSNPVITHGGMGQEAATSEETTSAFRNIMAAALSHQTGQTIKPERISEAMLPDVPTNTGTGMLGNG